MGWVGVLGFGIELGGGVIVVYHSESTYMKGIVGVQTCDAVLQNTQNHT